MVQYEITDDDNADSRRRNRVNKCLWESPKYKTICLVCT